MSKTALVTGVTGQTGAYLAKLLLEKGYKVHGAARRTSLHSGWRLRELDIEDRIELLPFELLEFSNISRTLEKISPDEIYNFAAQSFVATSFEQPLYTADVNALGLVRLLEAMRMTCPDARFYQASSSEMFGRAREAPQTELTPFHPRSPYGVSKAFGHWTVVNYRESYGTFGCSGMAFNHESPLRGADFVTRKIAIGFARIRAGQQKVLELGNLDAKRDWGFAGDYVQGMWAMLQHDQADDYVLATGVMHSVRQFVEAAANAAGFELGWKGEGAKELGIDRRTQRPLVRVSTAFQRPADVDELRGDASKARRVLGWRPATRFDALVKMMVNAEMARADADSGALESDARAILSR